jgi:hypothetical protein
MVMEKLKDGLHNSIYPLKTKINSTCTSNDPEKKKHEEHKGFFVQKG